MDLRKDVLYYDALVDFPAIGQENKLYLNKADGSLYYWDGAAYQLAGDGSGGVTSVTASAPLASSGGATPNISLTVPGNTTTFLRGDGTFATPPSGGLTNFTEAANSSAPNGTVPVNSLTATGAATNIDAAIIPKGTGSLMLDIPDNTATGGNKRGTVAIDLQMTRSSAAQVASGNNAIAIGRNNTSSGTNSIAIGESNNSSNSYSIALGASCTASGVGSFAVNDSNTASGVLAVAMIGGSAVASGNRSFCAGQSSTSSGTQSVCLGVGNTSSATAAVCLGSDNTASGSYSIAVGFEANAYSTTGRFAQGNGSACQYGRWLLFRNTTNDTAGSLVSEGTNAGAGNTIILSNQSAYRFKGTIIGKKQGTTDIASWDVDGLIVRGANAAATTLAVSNVTLVQNTPAWGTPTLAANTTTGFLDIQVTGAASTNIRWTAVIETTEVIYA